ncbi:hypothetical protein Dimus_038702 [Dionaea muscipula]
MMMMMMETQRMMLASMEAREQREEAREIKFVEVLDKISSRLDKLEVSNPISPAAVDDTHSSEIDLRPIASMGTDTQNPEPTTHIICLRKGENPHKTKPCSPSFNPSIWNFSDCSIL